MPPEEESRASRRGSRRARLAEVWRIELTRGLRSLAKGEFARAESHFARAHRHAPERPEVCYALGRERLRQGRLAEAEPLLRTAWDHDRTLAAAAAALARCLALSGGRTLEAHEVLDEALAHVGSTAGLLVVRAELLLEEERIDEAREVLERAQALTAEAGDGAAATREAVTACLSRTHNLEGIRLGRSERLEEALFAFKRAFDLEPTWAGPLVNMGAIFAQLGRTARARACYERALVLDPDNAVARYNLAHVSRERGDLVHAEAQYRRVLALEPEYPGVRLALSEVLLERDRAAEAITVLAPELVRAPDDVAVRFHLGMAYDVHGDATSAEEHLRRAIALEPDHVPALCRLGTLLARAGRYLEAAELVRHAHEVDPDRAAELMTPSRD